MRVPGLDQPAQHRPLADDLRVVGRVGGGRHARHQRVQVARPADPGQVAGVGQRRRHGDRVRRLAATVEVEDHLEDPGVGRPVEVGRAQQLDHVGDGVLGQQHAAEHRLLGGHVLRRRPVELPVVRAGAALTCRSWRGSAPLLDDPWLRSAGLHH